MLNFSRLSVVIGDEALDDLKKKTVLILGCGGVGGYVCEALARSNIGRVIIVDFDIVDSSNINRQIIALNSTIGLKKVDVLENRLKDINHDLEVVKIDKFIDKNNLNLLFLYPIDYFVDACDTVLTKKAIIDICLEKNIKFISCMGTGNKLDPSKLEIVDIRRTVNDPLARIIRKYVRDRKIKQRVMVLSSTEVPIKTSKTVVGSTAFVPSVAGLMIAGYIVRDFVLKK